MSEQFIKGAGKQATFLLYDLLGRFLNIGVVCSRQAARFHLTIGVDDVQVVSQDLEFADRRQVWRYKVSRGTRVNIVADKPVEHAVVKLQISPEIIASESGFA